MNSTEITADASGTWQCRWATAQDQDALLSLFKEAFGHVISKNLWRWKYDWQNKQGVLAFRDGKIIAYYGGIPRTFIFQGKTISAIQICDVMVAPEKRGILTKNGPFVLTARAYLNAQTGPKNDYCFAFGFPSGRHARLGEIVKLYARVDSFLEARWPATISLNNTLHFKSRPLNKENNSIIDTQWESMQAALSDTILPQKNTHYFNWRYFEHPDHHYVVLHVSTRWLNKSIGVLVLRDHGPEIGIEAMDLLASPQELSTLLRVAQKYAARLKRKHVFCWLTPRILSMLPEPEHQHKITDVFIATPDLQNTADRLQSRWWLMGGDTDSR